MKAEVAKQKAHAEAIAAEQKLVCHCFSKAVSGMVDKDVSYRIDDHLPGAYRRLRDDFNNALALLSATIQQIDCGAS